LDESHGARVQHQVMFCLYSCGAVTEVHVRRVTNTIYSMSGRQQITKYTR